MKHFYEKMCLLIRDLEAEVQQLEINSPPPSFLVNLGCI